MKYTNFVVVYNCTQRYNKKSEYANFLLYFYEISTFFGKFCTMTFFFFFILSPFASRLSPFICLLVSIGTSMIFCLDFFLLFTHYSRTIYALFTDNSRTIDMVSRRVRYEMHELLIYVKIYVFYPLLIPSARVNKWQVKNKVFLLMNFNIYNKGDRLKKEG